MRKEWSCQKATLEFNDGFEFRCAVAGRMMHMLLWQLDQEMRECLRYGSKPCVKESDEGASLFNESVEIATEHWRSRLHELAEELGVDLDDDYGW